MTDDTQADFLLRVEALNLDQYVYDTEDLSTIRGAGLFLLNAHRLLWNLSDEEDAQQQRGGLFIADDPTDPLGSATLDPNVSLLPAESAPLRLEAVTLGASIMVYRFQATNDDAERLRNRIAEWLRQHDDLRFSTWSVALAPIIDGRFGDAGRAAQACVRREQLSHPSLSLGPIHHSPAPPRGRAVRFCDIDGRRPGTQNVNLEQGDDIATAYAKAVDKSYVSPSARSRRKYGRRSKVRLYRMIGRSKDVPFEPTWHFEQLTERGSQRVADDSQDPDPCQDLAGKMAVIYIDGNQLGSLITDSSEHARTLSDCDRVLRGLRRGLMENLIAHITRHPRWQVLPSAEALQAWDRDQRTLEWQGRIETLLWGGDELIWVVPAWCGLDAVKFFFDATHDWSHNGLRLTHSVGLVFCSHKAPIRGIVRLARELAENVKGRLTTTEPRSRAATLLAREHDQPPSRATFGNALAYEVLESFDSLGRDFRAARAARRFPGLVDDDMLLSASDLAWLCEQLARWRHGARPLPSRRLHQLSSLLRRDPAALASGTENWSVVGRGAYERLITRIAETMTTATDARRSLLQGLNAVPAEGQFLHKLGAKWHHLIELWRYAPPGFVASP